jgi:hypothetical protein
MSKKDRDELFDAVGHSAMRRRGPSRPREGWEAA